MWDLVRDTNWTWDERPVWELMMSWTYESNIPNEQERGSRSRLRGTVSPWSRETLSYCGFRLAWCIRAMQMETLSAMSIPMGLSVDT